MDPFRLISSAIDAAKKLREIADNLKHGEMRNIIGDQLNDLADLKLELAASKEEIARLREAAAEREEREATDKNFSQEPEGYYYIKVPKNRIAGPYCQVCWDKRSEMLLMAYDLMPGNSAKAYKCPVCKILVRAGRRGAPAR